MKKKIAVLADQAALEHRASLEAQRAEEEAQLSAPLVSEAERKLAAAEKELSEARERLREAAGGRKRRLESLRAALSLYERTLGLRFVMPQAASAEGDDEDPQRRGTEQQRREREELRLAFSQVDPRDPGRECSLGLRLQGRAFSVLRCEPAECLDAVRRLCDALNSCPDDFAWFVREVRAEFRARVADEGGVGRLGV